MYRFSARINEVLGTLSFFMGAASLGIDPTSGGILLISVFLTLRFFEVAKHLREGRSQEQIKQKDGVISLLGLELFVMLIVTIGVTIALRAAGLSDLITNLVAFASGIVAYFALKFVKKSRTKK